MLVCFAFSISLLASARMMSVAPDGSADFSSVQAAIDSIPSGSDEPSIILIRAGRYDEVVRVPADKKGVRLVGRDAVKTVITHGLGARMKGPDGKELGTFRTPSVYINGDDFLARNITFENSAGDVGQAVAIAVSGDRCRFIGCRFLGWQDTIFDDKGRHYYQDCYIEGSCDYIFGGAVSYFKNCELYNKKNSYITAASTPQDEPFGYVFDGCKITAAEGVKMMLGRPWRDYAAVLFMNCDMDDCIRPEGWHNWSRPEREKTARYAEFGNTGPGANTEYRVDWAKQLTAGEAAKITPQSVLGGKDKWDPTKRPDGWKRPRS
jgi:pectinesterase